jgi:hypothetical protein
LGAKERAKAGRQHSSRIVSWRRSTQPFELGRPTLMSEVRSFDDQGLVVEGWGNWDGIALLRQIGALPTATHWRRSNSTFDLVVGRSLV